jgi:cobalt-zinc-cadmium efflux system outer membrane protein
VNHTKKNPFKKYIQPLGVAVFYLFTPLLVATPYPVPSPPNLLLQRVKLVEPQGLLSLSEALSLALLHNPALQSHALDIRINDVKTIRAGLLTNPELSIEGENFLGSGQQHDFNEVETTIAISQLFELGGKRAKRESLAVTERDLAIWDYESQRMDIIYHVAVSYIHVLANQARLKLASQSTAIAKEIHSKISEKVKAGSVSPLEQGKSRVELAKARLHHTQIASQLTSDKQNLASVWGSIIPMFKKVSGDLFNIPSIPTLTELLSHVDNNPELARWSAEIERYHRTIALAKAEKIPDITFTTGARHFAGENNFAVVADISVPLFIFDNKQTGVDEAEIILSQALQNQREVAVRIRSALIESYQQLHMSQTSINVIQEDVLPSSSEVLKAAQIAYKLGEIGALDLLDAQRTSFQSNRQHLEALITLQLSVAKIERLMGGTLHLNKNIELNK